MKAKKSYGQHFLKDERIAQRIVDSLGLLDQYKDILEVGPGKGVLTKYLAQKESAQLTVVEADKDMVDYLIEHYEEGDFRIVQHDFLKVKLHEIMEQRPFALIGNFPYNISSQIVFKMLHYKEFIPEMVGMFQKEVADRICAKHGSKIYGVTSVLTQAFYDAKYLFTVKAGSFSPPPKVLSGVIRLIRKKDISLPCSEKLFRQIVKITFGMRRKMLRNSLKPFLPKDVLHEDAQFQKRPENLSVQDFIELTTLIEEYQTNSKQPNDKTEEN